MKSNRADDIFNDMTRKLEGAVDDLLSELNTQAKQTTPRRSGRAANGWRYSRRYKLGYAGTVIENRVPYIAILDDGYSRQAPNGIIQPAFDRILRRHRKL